MSNALSIAAITAALRSVLLRKLEEDEGIPSITITTRPPDRAREGIEAAASSINIFLYNTLINPTWRNMDVPWRVKPGEQGNAPLPLNLFYIFTAYAGENEDSIPLITDSARLLGSHRLLGQVMSILHDVPLLQADFIHSALPADDQQDFPYDQVEHVRITPQSLTSEELSKIWTGFQTQYRLSAAYELSVVLIESQRPSRSPMPVLRRGPEDRGVNTVIGPFPRLEAIRRPAGARYGVQLGDTIELVGQNLAGEVVSVRFFHPLREDMHLLTPNPESTPETLLVDLPAFDAGTAAADWTTGFYAVDVLISSDGGDTVHTTNQLPLALSPIVLDIAPNPAPRDGDGNVELTITCAPEVLPEQLARLLLGEQEVMSNPHTTNTNTLTFAVEDAADGEFVVRLRLDGVDSLPLTFDENDVLIFDPDQKVTIT